MLWHFRLGHPNFMYLAKLFPELFINKKPQFYQCEICQFAKHTRNVYPTVGYKPSKPFSLIHSDIWGPSKVKNLNDARWFITFIDDHTRMTWTYLMKEKSETSRIFQSFYNLILTQFHSKIQVLKTDNARDYFNTHLGHYLVEKGIVHTSSCVDTPQQNGVAERKNRHLLEVSRAIMFTNNVPKYLWGEALLTATYLINRMPSRVLKFQAPRDILSKSHPHILSFTSDLPLKIFGCTAFVHIQKQQRSKLDPQSLKCVLLGYSSHQKGYKCYSPLTRKIYTTMDVTFFENQPYFPKTTTQGENSNEYHFWESSHTSPDVTPVVTLEQNSINTVDTSSLFSPLENTSHSPLENNPDTHTSPQLRVYSRRNRLSQQGDPITHTSPIPATNDTQQQSNPVDDAADDAAADDVGATVEPIIDDFDLPIAQRKGVRSCTKHPIERYVAYGKLHPSYRSFVANLDQTQIPNSIHEALKIPSWNVAVKEEIKALESNGTWTITELPKGKRPVGCKWVFSVKYKADGSIDRFKARLVAKGFTQSYGIDYQETFAPVAKLNTVRVLLSLAVNNDWPLYQLDVKNAFLNGDLEEEIYMSMPPGFGNSKNNMVCRLRKSLYGLKQSPRAWFEKFSQAITSRGYVQCQADHTLFIKTGTTGKKAILIVYVDDIIMTGDDVEAIKLLKRDLASEFEIKDLGHLKYFLGMEVARSKEGIVISQRKYILDLLKETGLLGCKPAETPMDPNKKIFKDEEQTPVNKEHYQRLVGKLIYLSHTRPDIAYSVGIVSQHMNEPTEGHLEAVKRILRYLKMTPGLGLRFKRTEIRDVQVYTDASWAGKETNRKSTTGYCSYVWGNLVTWRSKKQSVVSRSSAESEYRALALGMCEGMWIQRLLRELGMKKEESIKMFTDSQPAINIAKNPVHHDRTKHIEIDRHFISEKVNHRIVQLSYVPSRHQIADVLTKALPRANFEDFISKLGLYNIYNQA